MPEIPEQVLKKNFFAGKERLELQTLFDKYVILHLKLFTDLLENHPYSFLVRNKMKT